MSVDSEAITRLAGLISKLWTRDPQSLSRIEQFLPTKFGRHWTRVYRSAMSARNPRVALLKASPGSS